MRLKFNKLIFNLSFWIRKILNDKKKKKIMGMRDIVWDLNPSNKGNDKHNNGMQNVFIMDKYHKFEYMASVS